MWCARKKKLSAGGVDCVEFSWKVGARIGLLGQVISRYFAGAGWPPYNWAEIVFTVCCDGRTHIHATTSDLPKSFVYVKGSRYPVSTWGRTPQQYLQVLRAFIAAAPSTRSGVALGPSTDSTWESSAWLAGRLE